MSGGFLTGIIRVGGCELRPEGLISADGWHFPTDGTAHGPGLIPADCALCDVVLAELS